MDGDDFLSWRINASEVILGHWGRSGLLPLKGTLGLFFLVKSIERFHCIGAQAVTGADDEAGAMGLGGVDGLGCC